MTLTNGGASGGVGGGFPTLPPTGFGIPGFDATALSASTNILLQTNNDLILAIHKAIFESTQEINRKIEALRDDIRDIKLNQQKNDHILQQEAASWRTHIERLLKDQGERHLHDADRLQDMLMKLVVGDRMLVTKQPAQPATYKEEPAGFKPPVSIVTKPDESAVETTINTEVVAKPFLPQATTTKVSVPAPATVPATASVIATTISSLFGGGTKGGTNTFANLAAKAAESGGGGFLAGTGTSGSTVSSDTKTIPQFGKSAFGGAAKDFKFFQSPHSSLNVSARSSVRGTDDVRQEEEAGSDKEDETAEDYIPDVHYEPVVPLPPEVEVVSGEEGEEVIFVARCKLFRYDREAKENKERGLGDIKLLKNPVTNKYRCVMRREKVHKLCANFPIHAGMRLHSREGMAAVYTWACRDFSEEYVNGMDETFSARFKDATIAKEFYEKMQEAIADS